MSVAKELRFHHIHAPPCRYGRSSFSARSRSVWALFVVGITLGSHTCVADRAESSSTQKLHVAAHAQHHASRASLDHDSVTPTLNSDGDRVGMMPGTSHFESAPVDTGEVVHNPDDNAVMSVSEAMGFEEPEVEGESAEAHAKEAREDAATREAEPLAEMSEATFGSGPLRQPYAGMEDGPVQPSAPDPGSFGSGQISERLSATRRGERVVHHPSGSERRNPHSAPESASNQDGLVRVAVEEARAAANPTSTQEEDEVNDDEEEEVHRRSRDQRPDRHDSPGNIKAFHNLMYRRDASNSHDSFDSHESSSNHGTVTQDSHDSSDSHDSKDSHDSSSNEGAATHDSHDSSGSTKALHNLKYRHDSPSNDGGATRGNHDSPITPPASETSVGSHESVDSRNSASSYGVASEDQHLSVASPPNSDMKRTTTASSHLTDPNFSDASFNADIERYAKVIEEKKRKLQNDFEAKKKHREAKTAEGIGHEHHDAVFTEGGDPQDNFKRSKLAAKGLEDMVKDLRQQLDAKEGHLQPTAVAAMKKSAKYRNNVRKLTHGFDELREGVTAFRQNTVEEHKAHTKKLKDAIQQGLVGNFDRMTEVGKEVKHPRAHLEEDDDE